MSLTCFGGNFSFPQSVPLKKSFSRSFEAVCDQLENVVAKQALVLMVVAINQSWKIPIAYFLISSMSGAERENLIQESLSRLHEIEVRIVSLTCDGPSQNIAMIRELGAKLDTMDMKPDFFHPEAPTQKVHVLLDPCQILKLLRNVFSTVGVLFREDGQQIRWQYIEELHKLQEKEGLHLGKKLEMATRQQTSTSVFYTEETHLQFHHLLQKCDVCL